MSRRSSYRGTHRTEPGKATATTLAVLGGASLFLAVPAAALMAGSGVANAAPAEESAQCTQLPACLGGGSTPTAPSLFGPATFALALAPDSATNDLVDLFNPFVDLAGAIPIVNIFVGNGTDGTAFNPNGGNGGLFIGSGGDGYSATTAQESPAATAATAVSS